MRFIFLGTSGLLSSIVLQIIVKNKFIPDIVLIESKHNSKYPNLTRKVCLKNNIKFETLSAVSKSNYFLKKK